MGRKRNSEPAKPSSPWTWRGLLLALALLGLVTIFLWPSRGQSIEPGALAGHNLLFITIDTLRPDRLGSYGSTAELTPFLDRLASEGIRFARATAHVPVTLPSHASIFTSLYPTKHGVRDNGSFRLGPSPETLATVLAGAGYDRGAFVGAFVLDARFGLDRGFDVYDDLYGERRGLLRFTQLERRAELVVAAAERWISGRGGRPWFAWVHLFDPHAPYEAPDPAIRARFASDPYGAEVAYVDRVLSEFHGRLRASGRLDETLVVVLGDHGESLGEHGERTHGTFAYDSTLRVPWILWAPGRIRPQVFQETVRHVDVVPTVLDLLGVPPPGNIDGQSLRPFLTSERRYELPPSYLEAMNVHLTRDWAPLTGVVAEGHKLIRLPIPELYDLERDPGETENLYREKTALARRLGDTLDDITGGASTVEAETPDAETLARLRALGYVTAPVASRKGEYGAEDDPKRLIDVSNAYDEATELFGKGRVEEATAIFADIVKKQPRSSEALQSLAYALHQTGRIVEAIAILEGGVERGIQEPALWGTLSAYLLDAGAVERGVGLLEDLVRREPDYAEAHNYLGIAYGRMGRFDDARREFERVLELDPSSAATYNNMGSLALSQGKLEDAVRFLSKALELDPGLANAHNGLGVAKARLGDLPAAIDSWRRAVESDPEQYDALFNVALALAERAPAEAVPWLERFVAEAPRQRYQPDIDRARALLGEIRSRSSGRN